MKNLPLAVLHRQLVSIDSLLDLAGAKRYAPAEIEAHKAKELAAAPRANRLYAYVPTIDRAINRSWWFFSSVLEVSADLCKFILLGLATCFLMWLLLDVAPEHKVILWLLVVGIVASTIGIASFALMFVVRAVGSIKIRGPARWVNYEVEAYEAKYGPLPTSARTIVDTVARFAPQYTPWIAVLENNKTRLDPVLYIEAPSGHRRAVDIWL